MQTRLAPLLLATAALAGCGSASAPSAASHPCEYGKRLASEGKHISARIEAECEAAKETATEGSSVERAAQRSVEQHNKEAAAEAPVLDRSAAGGDTAHECGRGTSGNAHTSCEFAEKVRSSFAGLYESSGKIPTTVNAYSPVTNHEYTLSCFQVAQSLVECTTGTAAVIFPSPASITTPETSGSEEDEVGSTSHATDEQFCEEHECIGEFESEDGTVVECSDGTFSHAGGISGACSDHGGEA